MNKQLVIVFVKNLKLGNVKTRLAKSIGNEAAFQVYRELVFVTEKATRMLHADKRIYFSDAIVEDQWLGAYKTIQEGENLGDRMKNAFNQGFKDGYKHIVLIGSDLPDISSKHIDEAFEYLTKNEVVFGPAEDGGYYLIGLSKMHDFIFENKPWSQSNLWSETQKELHDNTIVSSTLETLNDIDTYEDLIHSDFYTQNQLLQQKINQLNA